jgi:hypothetical protein
MLVSSARPQSVAFASGQTEAATTSVETPIEGLRKIVVFIKLSCEENGKLWDVRGTGFFVGYNDSRLPAGKTWFVYLVTNKHVALCWNENGEPMAVHSISVFFNLNKEENGTFVKEVVLNPSGNVPWVLPDDDSVDLAAIPMVPNRQNVDMLYIGTEAFATTDILKKNNISEGEPVFFAGFFYQFPGTKRISPIIRQGIIAMMPDEKIPFVNTPERLYLADVHAFGGNSGSPAFINLAGLHNGGLALGVPDYKLIGVVNGLMTEDENFNLKLTQTLRGKLAANSGVSTIIPADELKALINGSKLQALRDRTVLVVTHQNPAH